MNNMMNNLFALNNLVSAQKNLGIANAGLKFQKSLRETQQALNWASGWAETQQEIVAKYNGLQKAFNYANLVAELKATGTPKDVVRLYAVSQSMVDAHTNHNNIIALNDFIQSHLQLVNVLNQLGGIFEQSNQLQKLFLNLPGLYLKKLKRKRRRKNKENPDTWNDLETAKEVTDTITNLVQESLEASEENPTEAFNQLSYKIITYYSFITSRIKSIEAKIYIKRAFFVLLASFGLRSDIISMMDVSNEEVLLEVKEGRKEEKSEHKIIIEGINTMKEMLKNLSNERVATLKTNLKNAPYDKSQNLGVVKEGQDVIVLGDNHKYLWIRYGDIDTGDIKEGFVLKKHFKRIK